MHWLSIGLFNTDSDSNEEFNESSEIRLPCPTIDLIRLSAATEKSGKSLERLLRLSPALLLFGLSGFRSQLGRSPGSTKEFVEWGRLELLSWFVNSKVGQFDHLLLDEKANEQFSFSSLHEFFAIHLAAKSNKQLRKSLTRFVVAFGGLKKRRAKKVVKGLAGKLLQARDFKCKRIRKIKTRWKIIDDWTIQIGDVKLDRLTDNALASLESTAEFAVRLHEEKLAAMKQLAYGASHEINNPLANIATRAQTLLAVETDHEKRHKLSVIYEQAMRAHEMISDMMLFAHPPGISPEPIAVRLLVRKILGELDPLFESRRNEIEVTVTVGVGVDQIEVDATQIGVAIKNLIQNSIEAIVSSSKRAGRVEVRFERADSGLKISVWDNGQKIVGSVRKHLFDPFFSGREAGRGLGFGLSKVWTIVKLHGGSVYLDTKVKSGTQFVVQLPQSSPGNLAGASEGAESISIRAKPTLSEEDAA